MTNQTTEIHPELKTNPISTSQAHAVEGQIDEVSWRTIISNERPPKFLESALSPKDAEQLRALGFQVD